MSDEQEGEEKGDWPWKMDRIGFSGSWGSAMERFSLEGWVMQSWKSVGFRLRRKRRGLI